MAESMAVTTVGQESRDEFDWITDEQWAADWALTEDEREHIQAGMLDIYRRRRPDLVWSWGA
jgi:hypothetical protein